MLETIGGFIKNLDGLIWGLPMILLLFGAHIFLTVRTGIIQRKTFLGIRLSVAKDKGADGDISQFGALTTALASTIGTGNIVGVGTAVALGGPGAVLWCWLTGVLGIVQHREKEAVPADVMGLVAARAEAKKAKDWARADALRAEIGEKGYAVEDTPQGPKVLKK